MAPVDIRATDKQNIDKIVLELKRLSRDFGISVLCISSFNRDNYMSPVNLSSFKESGAIEYSSDVLIGLQYYGMDYQEDETSIVRQKRIRNLIKDFELKGRNREPQSIQVKILKNRNGSKGDFVLNFYPMFNCFVEPENNKTIGNDEVWSKESGSY
jgi:replicative DNA helicase